jgi:hypothetical protein
MPAWQWAVDIAAVVLLAALLYGVVLVVRRRFLTREGGAFELSVRLRDDRPGHGWVLGIGRYRGEDLEWFRIFTPAWRPRLVWQRSELVYTAKRALTDVERHSLYDDQLVVVCETAAGPVEMAMSEPSLTGLQSWIEAGPPGQRAGKGG